MHKPEGVKVTHFYRIKKAVTDRTVHKKITYNNQLNRISNIL